MIVVAIEVPGGMLLLSPLGFNWFKWKQVEVIRAIGVLKWLSCFTRGIDVWILHACMTLFNVLGCWAAAQLAGRAVVLRAPSVE